MDSKMNLFDRISRRLLAAPARDFDGTFDFSDETITGWVVDRYNPLERRLIVCVVRGEAVIAQAAVGERGDVGWRFSLGLHGQVSGADVLHERIRVVVSDVEGITHVLRIEGSTQLQLINEHMSELEAPFLEIDFREGGNSNAFLKSGWSYQEKIHRWTDGGESSIACGVVPCARDCDLTILLWPFTPCEQLKEQELEVLVNQVSVGRFSISQQSFLRCRVPSSLLFVDECSVIRFLHPNATSAAILKVGNDPRPLAFAFKKLKLFPANGMPTHNRTSRHRDA